MGKRMRGVPTSIKQDSPTDDPYAKALRNLARYINDPVAFGQEVMGHNYEDYQKEVLTSLAKNRRVAWRAAHGVGKCGFIDDTVMLADGSVVKYKDLIGKKFEIIAFREDGKQVKAKATGTYMGEMDAYKITTRNGREIIRSGNHPLYVGRYSYNPKVKIISPESGRPCRYVEKHGWVHLSDIQPGKNLKNGDCVLLTESLPNLGNDDIHSDNECLLLGYLLGDGCIKGNFVAFAQIDRSPIKDDFVRVVKSLGSSVVVDYDGVCVVSNSIAKGQKGRHTVDTPVYDMVKSWGLIGKCAHDKAFPAWVWNLPDRKIALVLRGLFDTDGCFAPSGVPGIGLTSQRLIKDVEIAMTRLGIHGRSGINIKKYKGKDYPVWFWNINNTDTAMIKKFRDIVGTLKHTEILNKACDVETDFQRKNRWQHINCPEGYRWDLVKSIEYLGKLPMVNISVAKYHTYLTTFVEHNSWTAADAVLWFLFTRPNSKVITTASNWRQVNKTLWPEIHAHLKQIKWEKIGWCWAPDALDTMIKISNDWFATGEASDDAQKLEGFHAEHIMYVVDEAKIVPHMSFQAIEGAINVGEGRLLVISTPSLNPSGYFYDLWANPKPKWKLFKTPATESKRIPPEWIDEMAEEWGRDSAIFQARVMAEFPDQSDDTLIPMSWVEAASERPMEISGKLTFGVDVARKGVNESVIAVGCETGIAKLHVINKQDTMQVSNYVYELFQHYSPEEIRIDCDGIGGAVFDRLKELKLPVIEMHGSEAAHDKDRFANARAERWWLFRDRLNPDRKGSISIPNDAKLLKQLSVIKYGYTTKSQIKIEGKDDMEKRGLDSPDRADACVYALCEAKKGRSMVYSFKAKGEKPDVVEIANEGIGISNDILLKKSEGMQLPIPQPKMKAPSLLPKAPTCPNCQEELKVRTTTKWFCQKCNIWVPYVKDVRKRVFY